MKRRFQWASPTMVVACLALFVSLTGTSIAASHYLITSTKQIKPSVLTKLKGAKGATGATGATGSAGIASIIEVQGADLTLGSGYYGGAPWAMCPSGYVVVGTGWFGPFGGNVGGFVESYHTFVGGWFDNESSITLTANVQAICAQLSSVSASNLSANRLGAADYAADVTAAERAAELRH